MASDVFRWVSAAESCQIWDEKFNSVHQFGGILGAVVDVSWSADSKHLAFIRKGSTEIFTATLSSPQIYQSTTTINEGEPTALGFLNEFLIAGTNSGNLLLWDQSKHKLMRKYVSDDKSSVCRIQNNNSIIAAGHSGGSVCVYGLKTGQLTGQYSIPNSAGLRDLKISSVKNSLMAAAFNSGTVVAWNTCSKENNSIIAEFSGAHQSPASCIALSPVTDILMVSGGLDKCIKLYDYPKKKVLKTIETDAPVTAIDFTPDGTSLIVGTSRGKVFIYDLRSVGTPAQTITAHSGSITKLICRATNSKHNNLESGSKKSSLKPAVLAEKLMKKSSVPLSTNEPEDKLTRTVPEFHSEPRIPSRSGFISGSNGIPDFPSMDSTAANNELERKNSSLFSPLKGETSETLSSPSMAASMAASPFLRSSKPRPYPEYHDTPQPPSREVLPLVNEQEIHIASSVSSSKNAPLVPIPNGDIKQTTESSASATNVPMDFQAEFISRIVHDVEDNIREVLRCRFGDLIIQSAQQFLTLQTELEQLKQQVQDKAYLEEEVRRLRDEVNHLRNLY